VDQYLGLALIGVHQPREEVVTVSVLDAGAVAGAAHGNVCAMSSPADREFGVCESFAIGNRPAVMALRPRWELAIHAASGMVINIGKAETAKKFD
jgi:hypothetical protein